MNSGRPIFPIVALACWQGFFQNGATAKTPLPGERKNAEERAIARLEERGHMIYRTDEGLEVTLKPNNDKQEVTMEDAADLNLLENVVELRVVAYWGIKPEVFARFPVFPKVRTVGIHYGMPPKSLKYLSKFPSVEWLQFWGDQEMPLNHLPVLPKLRILEHEASAGKPLSKESIEHVVACRNLEEVEITLPVSKDEIRALKALPKLRKLQIGEATIVDGQAKKEGEKNDEPVRQSQ